VSRTVQRRDSILVITRSAYSASVITRDAFREIYSVKVRQTLGARSVDRKPVAMFVVSFVSSDVFLDLARCIFFACLILAATRSNIRSKTRTCVSLSKCEKSVERLRHSEMLLGYSEEKQNNDISSLNIAMR